MGAGDRHDLSTRNELGWLDLEMWLEFGRLSAQTSITSHRWGLLPAKTSSGFTTAYLYMYTVSYLVLCKVRLLSSHGINASYPHLRGKLEQLIKLEINLQHKVCTAAA